MIETLHGQMDETQPDPATGVFLEKRGGVFDTDKECGEFTEYWQLVHRSANTKLKHGIIVDVRIGKIGE